MKGACYPQGQWHHHTQANNSTKRENEIHRNTTKARKRMTYAVELTRCTTLCLYARH